MGLDDHIHAGCGAQRSSWHHQGGWKLLPLTESTSCFPKTFSLLQAKDRKHHQQLNEQLRNAHLSQGSQFCLRQMAPTTALPSRARSREETSHSLTAEASLLNSHAGEHHMLHPCQQEQKGFFFFTPIKVFVMALQKDRYVQQQEMPPHPSA